MSISRRSFNKALVGVGMSVLIGGVELRFMGHAEALSIIGTATWSARQPAKPINVINNKPLGIVVHHTASQNTSDYSRDQAYRLARNIQNHHMNTKGWDDTGQNFTVSRGGYVLEGRHRSLEALNSGTKHCVGAHAAPYNEQYLGIECEGTYMTTAPTSALYNQLVALCALMCQQYGLSPSSIIGHRDLNATSCPGDHFYAMLPQLRSDVQAALTGGPATTWPLLRQGHQNRRVTAAEYLLRHRSYSVVVDGYFDSQTTSAVRQFQTANGLTSDGIIGAATFPQLISTVRRGDNNNAVRALQSLLQISADGVFGSGTEAAVRNLQQSQGLTVDGIAGPNTWNAAFNLPL